jgi:hypothetical protein
MTVSYAPAATALNRLHVSLLAGAVTPASGQSLDAAGGSAQLVVGTSALSGATGVLATFTLQNPSFALAVRTATLNGVPMNTTASGSGTAAKADLRDSNGVVIIPGLTVGTSGTDIVIGSTTINAGDTVTCSAGTLTG